METILSRRTEETQRSVYVCWGTWEGIKRVKKDKGEEGGGAIVRGCGVRGQSGVAVKEEAGVCI